MLQRHPVLCNMLDIDPSGEELISSHAVSRINGYISGFGKASDFEEEWPKLGINEKCAEYVRKQMHSKNRGIC